ncbi:MAG: hypothetical protein AB1510_00900 [Bacillota bacterium]
MDVNGTVFAQMLHTLLLLLLTIAVPAYVIYQLLKILNRVEKRLKNIEEAVVELRNKGDQAG